jgi:tetratricopeptide (TPR) repeat protein
VRIAAAVCLLAWAGLAAARTPAKVSAKVEAAFTERYRTGVRWMRERQWERADAAFAEALTYRESPDARRMSRICRFNLCLERGAAFLTNRSLDSAVEQYQRALDLDSQSEAAIEGLRTAQYQAALRDGMRALSEHNVDGARKLFERCIEIRPQEAAARGQLQSMEAAARKASEWRASWVRVEECLAAQDAVCLERQVPSLAGGDGSNGELLPALERYGHGDLAGAEVASRNVGGQTAAQFRSLVRAQVRLRFVRRWAGWSAGLYGLTLVLGLYFGVRGIRVRQLGATA